VKESDIQAAILGYLALRHRFAFRVNNIPAFNRQPDGRMRALPEYTPCGGADIAKSSTGRLYMPLAISARRSAAIPRAATPRSRPPAHLDPQGLVPDVPKAASEQMVPARSAAP
jgi:hypothetical protein